MKRTEHKKEKGGMLDISAFLDELKKPLPEGVAGKIFVNAEKAILDAENAIMEARIIALEEAIAELKRLAEGTRIIDELLEENRTK